MKTPPEFPITMRFVAGSPRGRTWWRNADRFMESWTDACVVERNGTYFEVVKMQDFDPEEPLSEENLEYTVYVRQHPNYDAHMCDALRSGSPLADKLVEFCKPYFRLTS